MAIKDLYKKVEEEKKNEIKDSSISMSREDFISEHTNLINILRSGDRKAQEAEAVKQEKELKDKIGDVTEDEDEESEDED